MNVGVVLDILLLLLLASGALAGYRRGLLVTFVSAAGFLVGAALGLWLLPGYVALWVPDSPAAFRPAVLVGGTLFLALVVQGLFVKVVAQIAHGLDRSRLGVVDSVLGAVLTVVVTSATAWFTVGVLRVVVPGELARGIGQSRVVAAIDSAMPATSEQVLGEVKTTLDAYGFPRVFSTIGAEPIRPVAGVDPSVATSPAIQKAVNSVLRIDASAPACSRSQEGTGWVYSPGMVVTNAHVVAGSKNVRVRTGNSSLPAKVVAFDAKRDLAVLSVNNLRHQPLPLGRSLENGESAVVAGYPLGGPLKVDAARIREILEAHGDDIYGSSPVQRQVYSLLATVRPGNSGGPLLAPDGSVAGVVFARSLDDKETGYALTLEEARPVLKSVNRQSPEVSTGNCTKTGG
ncbi:MarP family serine protease [Austwickia chelonae]|uniref:MarP family serine protease n=1 Tax=Austwickia chelonae TaxID=100225 RepID=UPI000E24C5BB|nr:MarP family serine protease [Austwickia chelonae]